MPRKCILVVRWVLKTSRGVPPTFQDPALGLFREYSSFVFTSHLPIAFTPMSRFVSAGTNVEPVERDAEWLQAQQELENARRIKEEQSRNTDGKTLYEVLQANKGSAIRDESALSQLANMLGSLP